ncbi:hypothetical protein ACFL5Z_09430 [Planctomycetota bacterium]
MDHAKSKYFQNTPCVKQAYPELWRRINIPDGQIIWCYLDKTEIRKTGIEMVLWKLCLPETEVIRLPGSKVIQFVDDMVWNRILGRERECELPQGLCNQWREKSVEKYPNNPAAAKNYEKKCQNDYRNKKPKSNSWWDELFVQRGQSTSISALIRHPVRKDWIENKVIWKVN